MIKSSMLNPEISYRCLVALVVLAFTFSLGSASAEIKLTDDLSGLGFPRHVKLLRLVVVMRQR